MADYADDETRGEAPNASKMSRIDLIIEFVKCLCRGARRGRPKQRRKVFDCELSDPVCVVDMFIAATERASHAADHGREQSSVCSIDSVEWAVFPSGAIRRSEDRSPCGDGRDGAEQPLRHENLLEMRTWMRHTCTRTLQRFAVQRRTHCNLRLVAEESWETHCEGRSARTRSELPRDLQPLRAADRELPCCRLRHGDGDSDGENLAKGSWKPLSFFGVPIHDTAGFIVAYGRSIGGDK